MRCGMAQLTTLLVALNMGTCGFATDESPRSTKWFEQYIRPVLTTECWKQHGKSGLGASEWIPHIAQCLDDIAVIRSCWTNGINHAGGACQMNTCLNVAGRPSLGSWVSYGLGNENENLPASLVLCDAGRAPVNGVRNWGTGFMPAAYQGVRINEGRFQSKLLGAHR